jgi:hypothetical protein
LFLQEGQKYIRRNPDKVEWCVSINSSRHVKVSLKLKATICVDRSEELYFAVTRGDYLRCASLECRQRGAGCDGFG